MATSGASPRARDRILATPGKLASKQRADQLAKAGHAPPAGAHHLRPPCREDSRSACEVVDQVLEVGGDLVPLLAQYLSRRARRQHESVIVELNRRGFDGGSISWKG